MQIIVAESEIGGFQIQTLLVAAGLLFSIIISIVAAGWTLSQSRADRKAASDSAKDAKGHEERAAKHEDKSREQADKANDIRLGMEGSLSKLAATHESLLALEKAKGEYPIPQIDLKPTGTGEGLCLEVVIHNPCVDKSVFFLGIGLVGATDTVRFDFIKDGKVTGGEIKGGTYRTVLLGAQMLVWWAADFLRANPEVHLYYELSKPIGFQRVPEDIFDAASEKFTKALVRAFATEERNRLAREAGYRDDDEDNRHMWKPIR